ncbi:diguanylate cyclase, partial [Candidatus Magnetomorum sp. HK-1]
MSTKKQALIIDDDSSISMLLEAMLAKMDYQCTQAETAEIALDILKNKSFLLIITDYMLPGMNGILFMKRVKKLYPNQSVIIMSGYGNQINYQDIINAGASDYLKKPIERAELTSRILRIEREYDILKELQETNLKLESVLNNANALTSEMIDNQDELANILKYNTDAAMVVDENFTIINVNEQFLSLFSIVDPPLEGKKCYDIFPNSFCSKEDCVVKPIVEGANKVEKEKEYISPDNIRIPCKITAFPFKEKTGKLKGIINIYKDLREKELEKDKGIVLGMLQSSAKVGKQKVDKLNQIYQRMDRYYLELKQTEKRLKNSEKELRILNNISKILLTTQDI